MCVYKISEYSLCSCMHPLDMDDNNKFYTKNRRGYNNIFFLTLGVQTNYGKLLNFCSESFSKFCDARKAAKLKTFRKL